jgi:hypothetical protein
MRQDSIKNRIRRLEMVAGYIRPSPTSLLPCDKRPYPVKGQVWVTKTECKLPQFKDRWLADEPVLVVLMDPHHGLPGMKQPSCLVIPVLQEIEMAGPKDACLPSSLLGYPAIACVGDALEILFDNLQYCIGTLPERWVNLLTDFSVAIKAKAPAPATLRVGLSFLDDRDVRAVFHSEELPKRLEYLHAPVRASHQWTFTAGREMLDVANKKLSDLRELLSSLGERLGQLRRNLQIEPLKSESFLLTSKELVEFAKMTMSGPENSEIRRQRMLQAENRLLEQIQETERRIAEQEEIIRRHKKQLEVAASKEDSGR